MKGLLINSKEHTITEVEYDGDYRSIYKLLGEGVDDFNAINMDRSYSRKGPNVLWVDGEGLLKNPRYFFNLKGYAQPLAGNGLVLGDDGQGDSKDTTFTVETLTPFIRYTEHSVEGFKELSPAEKTALADAQEARGLPRPGFVIGSRPVFGAPVKDEE